MTAAVLKAANELLARSERAALCSIIKTQGSTPLKTGASMLVREDGAIIGTIGGGALEYRVIEQAMTVLSENSTQLFEHQLVRDHNMCCGGTVTVYIEPLPQLDPIYIFGAGHIGKALASLLQNLDFKVTVVDKRQNIFSDWSSINVKQVNAPASNVLRSIAWNNRVYIVIATHSHPLDREILRCCVKQPFYYCGMIGSLRKVKIARQLFLEQHLASVEELDRIDMPMGINIGAETPNEIAISIAATIIAVNRQTKLDPVPQSTTERQDTFIDTSCVTL